MPLDLATLVALGLEAWWKAGSGARNSDNEQASDGELVSTLVDQTANGRNATASGSDRLPYRVDGINGHGALESLSGSKEMVTAANCGTMMSANVATVIDVVSVASAPNNGTFNNAAHLWTVDNGGLGLAFLSASGEPGAYAHNDDGSPESTPTIDSDDGFLFSQPVVIAVVHLSGQLLLSINGGTQVPVTSGNTSSLASPMRFFANYSGASPRRYFRGRWAERLVFDAGLAGATLADIINELLVEYSLGGNVSLAEQARIIGSTKLIQTRESVLVPTVQVSMRDALDFVPGALVALSHPALPHTGIEAPDRYRCLVEHVYYNPGAYEGGGNGSRFALRDMAPIHAAHWSTARTEEGGSGATADGVAELGNQPLTFIRSATKYGDNPGDSGQIIAFGPGVRALARQGHVMERASAGNLQYRGSFVSGFTGLANRTGSIERALETALGRFDRDITPNALRITANPTLSITGKQPLPASDAYVTGDVVVISLDVLKVTGEPGWVRFHRDDNVDWNDATAAFGSTAVEIWHSTDALRLLDDTGGGHERRCTKVITPGNGRTLQVILGVPIAGGVANQSNVYSHVQQEKGRWPSSRMVTDDVVVARDLDVFSRANALLPLRTFPLPVFTWVGRVRPSFAWNDSVGACTYFAVTFDADNYLRGELDGASHLWRLAIRAEGENYTATAPATHAADDEVALAFRLDDDLVASVFVDGVRGTDADVKQAPTQSGEPPVYIGCDGLSQSLDGGLGHNRLVGRAMSDAEIVAWSAVSIAATEAAVAARAAAETSGGTVHVAVFDADGTFTPPAAGDYIIEAIGPGGGGGPMGSPGGGGGGAGARARSTKTLTVTPYAIVVGTGGAPQADGSGTSSFDGAGADQVIADFGQRSNSSSGGPGGVAGSSVGDVVFDGGTGGDSDDAGGAGGGGSPTFAAAGANGSPNIGGVGGAGGAGEGDGGAGGDSGSAGTDGAAPGAGGGGGSDTNDGGSGADGRVTITWVEAS